jgi:hypothetical protein
MKSGRFSVLAILPYSANARLSRVGVPPPWVARRISEARTVPAVKDPARRSMSGQLVVMWSTLIRLRPTTAFSCP